MTESKRKTIFEGRGRTRIWIQGSDTESTMVERSGPKES